jgi:hypothetical protein
MSSDSRQAAPAIQPTSLQVCVKRLAQEARRTGALASPGALADARNAVGALLSLIASRCAREVQVGPAAQLL